MANNDDDDPFVQAPTRARPRPGAGRRTVIGPRQQQPTAINEPAPPVTPFRTALPAGIGMNPLVRAASNLLILTAQIRDSRSQMDASALRRHALEEIRRFEEQARAARVANDVVVWSSYVLCAGLDEAVLSTPWGSQSEWAHHSLLVTLHREASGGERFFELLERISQDPSAYLDLMELQYLCLAFGFAGKFQMQERGEDRLRTIQQNLYRTIRQERGPTEAGLSLRWKGLEEQSNPLIEYVPWWIVGATGLVVLAIAFTTYLASLGNLTVPVHAELAKVGLEDFTPRPVAPAPVAGPTLKQLLAADEQSGALTVQEQGSRTVVTLVAPDLFPSGDATVNPVYEETLHRVALALNKVRGRVMLIGHTDDQPIRSLRYKDNIALSRERAGNVQAVLLQWIDDRARLSRMGVGSLQPLYRPENTPENRARNRRVEVVHIRES
jgi:type VI secretion system protein ImpK